MKQMAALSVFAMLACGTSREAPTEKPKTAEQLAAEEKENQTYLDLKAEMQRVPWVKDVYFSPGTLNLGVIRREKNWSSPMIGTYVKAILKRHGLEKLRVRFVDIEEVVYQKKSV